MKEEHLYGRHPVLEALRSGQDLDKVYLQEGVGDNEAIREIRRRLREQSVPFIVAPRAVLDRLAGNAQHQGVVGTRPVRAYSEWSEVLDQAQKRGCAPLAVVANEVQDPRNLGSIIRSADAAGFHGVVVPGRRAAHLTSVVSKAAAGADAHVPVVKIVNVARFLEEQAEEGFHVVGADASATLDYREANYQGPLILVIGGEHKGLGRLVGQKCHQVVRIPMRGECGSLNVSVAAALLMYEAARATK